MILLCWLCCRAFFPCWLCFGCRVLRLSFSVRFVGCRLSFGVFAGCVGRCRVCRVCPWRGRGGAVGFPVCSGLLGWFFWGWSRCVRGAFGCLRSFGCRRWRVGSVGFFPRRVVSGWVAAVVVVVALFLRVWLWLLGFVGVCRGFWRPFAAVPALGFPAVRLGLRSGLRLSRLVLLRPFGFPVVAFLVGVVWFCPRFWGFFREWRSLCPPTHPRPPPQKYQFCRVYVV